MSQKLLAAHKLKVDWQDLSQDHAPRRNWVLCGIRGLGSGVRVRCPSDQQYGSISMPIKIRQMVAIAVCRFAYPQLLPSPQIYGYMRGRRSWDDFGQAGLAFGQAFGPSFAAITYAT